MSTGETNLGRLLSGMRATLDDKTYVFVTVPDDAVPQGLAPRMMFREAEGTALILEQQDAIAAGLPANFPCRMITLNVHSALEAVGFIARVATTLAAQGMGVNPVSGFYHDHLFVPEDRADDAMKILKDLAAAQGD